MIWRELTGWLKQIPLRFWLVLALLPVYLLWRLRKQLGSRRRSRVAENWPIVEGCAIYAHVMDGLLENSPEKYVAFFSYYFSLTRNGETDYFSGEFSRLFSEEEQAQKWLDSLKEKKIPVRVQPGNPNVSAVLFDDLVAKFPVPTPAMLEGGLAAVGPGSKLPYSLRWPTEMMASLTTMGFCLSLVDHLFRVLADRPAYPRLAIALWIGFVLAVIPFEIWFRWKSGCFSFDLRKRRNKGPLYLRLLTSAFNLYVASSWLIDGTRFVEYFHLHRERLDPIFNGALLALVLGNYAASLYGRLESIEESPVFSASKLRPE